MSKRFRNQLTAINWNDQQLNKLRSRSSKERCGCGKPAVIGMRRLNVKANRVETIPRCFEHAKTTHKLLTEEEK